MEMQLKELETKRQLLEEERELERKVKRTALENDNVRFQATSAWDKSPFNSTQKKSIVTSHDFAVHERDVSPRAILRYISGYTGSSNLTKLKLNTFDGNPFEWPEWSSMFIATVDQRRIKYERQRCDAQHSWHARNKRSDERKGSSQNKGAFKGAFNRNVCTPVNLLGKHKLQKQFDEAILQSLEWFTQQKLHRDGSWPHPWSSCLLAATPIGLQDRNTKWTYRCSNRAKICSQWTHDEQKKTKCLSFRFLRRCISGWEYPNLVGHRNWCFQNQRRQSVKEGTAGTKDAREYDEVHRRAVRSENDENWARAKPTKQLKLSLRSASLTGAKISNGPKPEEFVSTIKR